MNALLFAIFAAAVVMPSSDALKCGGPLTSPCLGETDKRYDPNIPSSIIEQDPTWKQYEGFWKISVKNYDTDGTPAKPKPHIPGVNQDLPYTVSEGVSFFNHTIIGSRIWICGYYLYGPAPESFCNQTFDPPSQNVIGSGVCGVNGLPTATCQYGTSTHENQGDVELFRVSSSAALGRAVIDFNPPGRFSWIDSGTLWGTSTIDGIFSQNNPYVFFDNNTAFANLNNINLITRTRQTNAIAELTRMEESEWIAAIEQAYEDTNVQVVDRLPVPLQIDTLDQESYPTEEEWCGGVGSDPACTVSPFQEPDAKLKTGALMGFLILGLVLFCVPVYALYRYRLGQQELRIKDHFIRGIARNISITPSAGALSHENLLEEFQRIDKDKGGTIEKEELEQWMADRELGISAADFNALWIALDRDGSGNIDFVEFCTFLSGCGQAFDEVYDEQQKRSSGTV
jgi:hypothetical protein